MGDAKQALRWLERALMLDASLEAAQADHSLALAALGEPVALQELLAAWAGRSDVPPALWRRLNLTAQRQESEANGVAAMARKLLVPSNGWQQLAELQLLAGHETNLGQSPSLEELRITPPDGPVNLPLAEPLRAVSGNAASLGRILAGRHQQCCAAIVPARCTGPGPPALRARATPTGTACAWPLSAPAKPWDNGAGACRPACMPTAGR
jgi:hypothetical protein